MARPPKRTPPPSSDEEPTDIGTPLDGSDEETEPAAAPLSGALIRLRDLQRRSPRPSRKTRAASKGRRGARAEEQTSHLSGESQISEETQLVDEPAAREGRSSLPAARAGRRTRTTSHARIPAVRPAPRGRASLGRPVVVAPGDGARGFTNEALVAGLERAVQGVQLQRLPLETLRSAFKAEIFPLLRQVLERAGGDGLDAYLSSFLPKRERRPAAPLLADVLAHVERINEGADRAILVATGKRLVGAVKRVLAAAPRPLSKQFLVDELENRVELGTVLAVLFSSREELAQRRKETDALLENIRLELRHSGGRYSDTMFRTFSRLKTERRLIEAEEERRERPRKR